MDGTMDMNFAYFDGSMAVKMAVKCSEHLRTKQMTQNHPAKAAQKKNRGRTQPFRTMK